MAPELSLNAFDNAVNMLVTNPPDPLLMLVVEFVGDESDRAETGMALLVRYRLGNLSVEDVLATSVPAKTT